MTTTIQATAKRYKLQMLLSTLLVSFGVVVIIVGAQEPGNDGPLLWGAAISALGLAWFLVVRFMAWWNHS